MNKSQQESGASLTTLTLAVLAVGVVAASISWFVAGRSSQRTQPEQGHVAASYPEFERTPTFGEPIGENIVDGVIAFGSRDLLQTIQVYESSDGQGGQERKNLIVERTEVDPSTGERVRTTRRYVTSLEIVDVAARFHNDIFVVLRKESTLYVERWLLFDEPGAWTATLDPTPQGGPVVTPDSTTFIQGGVWIHPSERAGTLIPERRAQLQSMPWDGSYRGISIDPDGRYFIIAEGRGLYQFPTVGGSAGTLVSSPAMGVNFDALISIYPADAAGYGRVFICRFDAAVVGRLDDFALIDNENDGVFDTHSTAERTGEIGDLGDIQGNITRLFYTGD